LHPEPPLILKPAGVLAKDSREELVFFLGNAQTGEIGELQVRSSLPNLRESDLPLNRSLD
jgi:hypothetical protein